MGRPPDTQTALLGYSPCSRAQKGPGHWPPPEPECAKPSPCLEQSQAHPHLAADASTLVLTSAVFLLLLSTPTWAFLGDSFRSHLVGPADLFIFKLISVPEELSCPSTTLPELWSRLPYVCVPWSAQAALTKCHRHGNISSRHSFLTVLEPASPR